MNDPHMLRLILLVPSLDGRVQGQRRCRDDRRGLLNEVLGDTGDLGDCWEDVEAGTEC